MDIIEKIGGYFDALNESKVWEYLKSIINKIVKLLKFYEEDEAAEIISYIPEA